MAANDEWLAGQVVVGADAMLAAVEEADTIGGETADTIREIARAFLRLADPAAQSMPVESELELLSV